MANESNRSEANDDRISLTELDLLEALLTSEDVVYPWNPCDPESEAYFKEQEQQLMVEDWWEEEIAEGATKFFSQVEQIWNEVAPPSELKTAKQVNHLQANLQQRFAAYVPQGWLSAIAHQAYQVLTTQTSMAHQLVQCVQELLPNWAEDDLLVLARPFAYNMRSADTIAIEESWQNNNRCRDWAALSEIEQARTSLAIARYALAQIQNPNA